MKIPFELSPMTFYTISANKTLVQLINRLRKKKKSVSRRLNADITFNASSSRLNSMKAKTSRLELRILTLSRAQQHRENTA